MCKHYRDYGLTDYGLVGLFGWIAKAPKVEALGLGFGPRLKDSSRHGQLTDYGLPTDYGLEAD